MSMRIAVLGAGAIGSLIAAKLVDSGYEVHVHARGEHGAALAVNGLSVSGVWDKKIKPDQWTVSLDEVGIHDSLNNRFDQVIITCKSKDTEYMAKIAKDLTNGPVMSLQNGLGNKEVIQKYKHENYAVAVTTNAVKRPSPGSIEWVGKGNLVIGGPKGTEFVDQLNSLEAIYQEDLSSILWNKLLINIAINPIAAICGVKNGALLEEPLISQAESTMLEGAKIARLIGIDIGSDLELIQNLHHVLTTTSDNTCSMLVDVKLGKETEIDSLCGQIVERGEQLGTPTPLNSILLAQIKSLR